MVETDEEKLYAALKKAGGGSFLRGWRRELDPDGSLDVGFLEFCQAAKRLNIAVDALKLFGEDSPDSLELIELNEKKGQLVEDFRQWLADKMGGPGDMFAAWEASDGSSDGKLTKDAFMEGVQKEGFTYADGDVASAEDMEEIFNLLDSLDLGYVVMEDVMFLETDPKRREGAINKAKDKARLDHEELLSNFYKEHSQSKLPNGHRLAPRHWHSPTFDYLPKVAIQKRLARSQQMDRKKIICRAVFMAHVQKVYGNGVRCWRRALDPHAKFEITKADLGRYVRSVNMDVELDALWDSIDMDGDETICLEEVAHTHGAALAEFRHWATEKYGSCALCWDALRPHVPPDERWKSPNSMKYDGFMHTLKAVKWSGLEQGYGQKLCSGLDMAGCGIVTNKDFEWLDKWDPPEWLCIEPDPEAWCELAALLLEVHGHPLRAWRAIDEDNSNIVSWSEFKNAAAHVGFKGNVAGAWRVLDDNVSGTITMQEFDGPSSELLQSFKEWLDEHYGSVEFAFKQIDTDGSGSLTCNELKRACKRQNWDGDVQQLFSCLQVESAPGKRSLSSQDLAFLDSWKPNPDEWEEEVEKFLAAEREKNQRRPTIRKADRPRSSSKTSELLPLMEERPMTPGAMAPAHYNFPATTTQSKPRTQKSGPLFSRSEGDLKKVYGVEKLPVAGRIGHPSRPPQGPKATEEDKVASIKKEMEKLRAESSRLDAERKHFQVKAQKAKGGPSSPKPGRRKEEKNLKEALEAAAEGTTFGGTEASATDARPTTGGSVTFKNSRVIEMSQGPQ